MRNRGLHENGNAPGQTKTVRVRVRAPDATIGDALCSLTFDADEPGVVYKHDLRVKVDRPKVSITPVAISVPDVRPVPSKPEVFADVHVAIVNGSAFNVGLRRGFYTGSASGVPSTLEVLDVPWGADGRSTLAAGATVQARLRRVYSAKLADQHPLIVDRHDWGLALLDPSEESQYSDFESCARTKVEIVLKKVGGPA